MKFRTLLTVLALLPLISCGGGGGGGDSVADSGIANVRIKNNPNLIDIGDITFISINVDSIIEDSGIILKVQFPEGLSYLQSSSTIDISGTQVIREPDMIFNSETQRSGYLIYFISQFELENGDDAKISLQLIGESPVSNGSIGVDVDLDNPNIPNANEIDAENPKFSAEDEVSIKVIR